MKDKLMGKTRYVSTKYLVHSSRDIRRHYYMINLEEFGASLYDIDEDKDVEEEEEYRIDSMVKKFMSGMNKRK
jgi:hypothetical protein